ncbi:hypothetical protein BLNAU_9967 [Blattamonas nauphoetae]|uniref:Uncharacterized protein n=1 Tax=Blattamonas nauphoetae TaxID=2049346 RepID=A0ABQ9XU91_9EUKA|nr:hypothetical protein BLNAU_9967 [Blattamonas nauphoetae]
MYDCSFCSRPTLDLLPIQHLLVARQRGRGSCLDSEPAPDSLTINSRLFDDLIRSVDISLFARTFFCHSLNRSIDTSGPGGVN